MINMHSYDCQAFLIDYGEVEDVEWGGIKKQAGNEGNLKNKSSY